MGAQITMLIVLALSLGIILSKHGQPRDEKWNVWTALAGKCLLVSILYWGGFWDAFFK